MSSKICRWGILGSAGIAQKNWQSIGNAENAELVAVASRDVAKSQDFIDRCSAQVPHRVTPEAMGSYDDLLARDDINAIYLPIYEKDKPLYIGFFNTGAYQESIGGFGGLQHCLIPHPKHIIIDKNKKGEITTKIFKDQQKSKELLSILGYEK